MTDRPELDLPPLPDLAVVLGVPADRDIDLRCPKFYIRDAVYPDPAWSDMTMVEIHFTTRRGVVAGFAFMRGDRQAVTAQLRRLKQGERHLFVRTVPGLSASHEGYAMMIATVGAAR